MVGHTFRQIHWRPNLTSSLDPNGHLVLITRCDIHDLPHFASKSLVWPLEHINIMKRIYEFITRANQVLLFFAIIGGLVLVSFVLANEFSGHYEPPHVLVAQSPDEAKGSIVEDVRFLGQASDYYVFGILKHIVSPSEKSRGSAFKMISSLSGEDGDIGEMVNVVFSKGEQRVKTLLPNDGLVLLANVSGNYRSENIDALLFRCVTEDTDGNHRLDKNDRNSLYVISTDLKKPDLVIEGVLDFQIISPANLMAKTGTTNDIHFWDINTLTQTKKEVLWK
jgi:hypothetical protein